MQKAIVRIIIFFLFGFISAPHLLLAADPSKDPFYTQGVQLDAPPLNTVTENIDPFSGILTLAQTDIHLPGNGGLDVNIMRTYNSMIWGRRDTSFPGLVAFNEKSPLGIGWAMHMGIVRNPNGTGSSNRFLPDNPVVEMPDGSQHVLYRDINDTTRFITRDFWVYRSLGNGVWELTLTDGTTYTFEYNSAVGYSTRDSVQIAQATRIKNSSGNSVITIQYDRRLDYQGQYYSYLIGVTDSVGRNVVFNYNYTNHTLTSIAAAGRVFYYYYQTTLTTGGYLNFLNNVTVPVGNPWTYSYYPSYELSAINFPTGGMISYGYNDIFFRTGQVNVKFRVVVSRATSGREINPGTWTYTYNSGGASGDITTINGPSVTETHKFFGWGYTGTNNVWKIGLPISKDFNFNGATLSESYAWSQGSQVSNDDISNADWNGTIGQIYDPAIYVPFLSSKALTRDGRTYTTSFSSYDYYGNPQGISESGDISRTTAITYWNNAAKNIVKDKPLSRTITGGFAGSSAKSWTYDLNSGNVTQINDNGVITGYSYNANGNLESITDANNKTTSYLWTYGRVSRVTNPIYFISRDINSNGTIASETNGRGFTTSYSYDGNLRITGITPPVGNPISFFYPADSSYKRQTRGGYSIDYLYDGFGRPRGTTDSKGVTTTVVYNAYGVKDYTDSNIGDKTNFDYFGRIKQVVHKDTLSVSYSYSLSNATITDENNGTTTLTYNTFGNPDEKYLMAVSDQAVNTTSYTRNIHGSVTGITQGTITRAFSYNTKNFLTSETNPESGTITYARDNVGNMTGKTDSSGSKTYTYDGINRLTGITAGSSSISFAYDNANNRTSMTSPDAAISYTYDAANRPTQKTETIAGRIYTTSYGYDGNDNITNQTYPSGRAVSYGYNSNNELTFITGFGGSVTSVSYNTAGLPTAYTSSNGITTSLSYSTRNLTTGITAGTALNVTYGYDTRGNTTGYTNNLDTSKNQTFSYDGLSRLTGFNGAWGSGSFSYDIAGNRNTKAVAGLTTTYGYVSNRLTSASGGEPASYSYNGIGALTGGTWQSGNYSLAYDPFDNLKTYTSGTTTLADFGYDGDGLRVTKTAAGKAVVYHYDQARRVISKNDGNNTLIADYIYLNEKLIANISPLPEPNISVVPLSDSFGTVYVNTTSPAHTFTISNTGTANLVIGTISLTGADPSEFVKNADG